MQATYENHLALRQNKLCPFKLLNSHLTGYGICNWHKNPEIIYVTEGTGIVQYGGDSIKLEKGDIIAVNSDVLHGLASESSFDFLGIIIDDAFCAENGIRPDKILFERKFRDLVAKELILDVQSTIENYKSAKTPILATKARISVLKLLVYMVENHTITPSENNLTSNPSEEHVKTAISYLNNHFTEDVTLERLAKECGVTRYHLARVFKRYTAETVFTYLNSVKCKNAESMLREGASVTEAALASGFESISYFSRTYKKVVGYPPSHIKH